MPETDLLMHMRFIFIKLFSDEMMPDVFFIFSTLSLGYWKCNGSTAKVSRPKCHAANFKETSSANANFCLAANTWSFFLTKYQVYIYQGGSVRL